MFIIKSVQPGEHDKKSGNDTTEPPLTPYSTVADTYTSKVGFLLELK